MSHLNLRQIEKRMNVLLANKHDLIHYSTCIAQFQILSYVLDI